MLYLEDYLEMIENLPMEMRDRFTDMRELDLQVQNTQDNLEDKVKKFFERCASAPTLKQDWKDEQMKKIKQEYLKILDDSDEKIQLANQMHEMLERYLRKLDLELSKFKLELEADNAGITEILEKRSLDMENDTRNHHHHRGEKRKHSSHTHNHVEKRMAIDRSIAHELARGDSLAIGSSSRSSAAAMSNHSPAVSMFSSNKISNSVAAAAVSSAPVSYNLATLLEDKPFQAGLEVYKHQPAILGYCGRRRKGSNKRPVGGGELEKEFEAFGQKLYDRLGSNSAIQLAASQAIGATLNMSQGRRTEALKASYEAVKQASLGPPPATLSRSQSTASIDSLSSGLASNPGSAQKGRNKRSQKSQQQQHQQVDYHSSQLAQQLAQPSTSALGGSTETIDVGVEDAAVNWQVDPNEPRYCVCNDVSYGDMVGCDNPDCPIEWFHYGCVGLTSAPRGKWFCPQCTCNMKRRGRK